MPALAEVRHDQWIAAPLATVQGQFADLDHRIAARVHPKLRFEVLERRVDAEGSIEHRDDIERRGYPRAAGSCAA